MRSPLRITANVRLVAERLVMLELGDGAFGGDGTGGGYGNCPQFNGLGIGEEILRHENVGAGPTGTSTGNGGDL